MTTTDHDLTEQIARAIRLADTGDSLPPGFAERMWDEGITNRDKEMCLAAAVLPIVKAAQAEAWRMAGIRSAPLLEAAWDEGNAMGLDGWTGPGRGEEPDDHATQRRERTVDRLADELAARADQIEKEPTR